MLMPWQDLRFWSTLLGESRALVTPGLSESERYSSTTQHPIIHRPRSLFHRHTGGFTHRLHSQSFNILFFRQNSRAEDDLEIFRNCDILHQPCLESPMSGNTRDRTYHSLYENISYSSKCTRLPFSGIQMSSDHRYERFFARSNEPGKLLMVGSWRTCLVLSQGSTNIFRS